MKSFRTVRYETGKDTGKAALTFAHLSDLHGCFYGENQEGLLEAIYEADPDLVVVSGDMIVGKPGINRKTFAFFKELTAKYPVSVPFEKNGRKLMIAGYEAEISYFSRFNRKIPSLEELKSHLGEKDPETETVLLAHNPMFFSVYKEWGADLTFSGHLHGGYIRIPGIGGVISPQFQLFPKYDRGVFEEEGHTLCVSAGLGDHTISPRFFNPAELPILIWHG